MPGCKVEDVARIVAPSPSHRGYMVEVLESIPQPGPAIAVAGGWWMCKCLGWTHNNVHGTHERAVLPDAWLQPFRGDPEPVATPAPPIKIKELTT